MVDPVTRNDGMAVLCNTKVVEYKKSMIVDFSMLRDGWKERKQKQWNSIYCDGSHWQKLIDDGWTVSTTLISKSGERFWFKAEC